ncbi:unnamed protein product [Penicillium nalgiovense]|nr:unnamed protein product [Penicillium nalgiovense]
MIHGIPSTQWAQVFQKQGTALEYSEIEVPDIRDDEILVQVKFSGVCHTDFHAWKGDWRLAAKTPLVGGHEGAGIAVRIGNDVTDITVGDRVGVQWINTSCGDCEFCFQGDEPLCPSVQLSGYTVDGTFQQYCVCKASNAVRIPEGITLDAAAPILCAGMTVHKALKEANLKQGQIVAIAGAGGGLGSLACQYAKACGYKVLALSTGPSKELMCTKKLGVDYYVDYKASPDLVSEIKSITNGGPHAAIVVAAAEMPFNQAVQYIRPKGTVVAVGLPPGMLKADLFSTVVRMINIKGSYVGNRTDTEEALGIFSRSRFTIPYEIFDLGELPMIYDRMANGEMQGRAVVKIPEISITSNVTSNSMSSPNFTQSQYNIGTFLAYRLQEMGVHDYFVVPGDFNLKLLDQILKNENLRMVGCCNELNAGYAADGYARSSPMKVAVVVVTFMVGGLSVINAIAGAYSDNLRIVVISGCPKSHTFGQDCIIHHTLGTPDRDQALRMFKEVTTAAVRLDPRESNSENLLDQTLMKCVQDSLPIYIEIPTDLVEIPCAPPRPLTARKHLAPHSGNISSAVDAFMDSWRNADRPLLIVGGIARQIHPSILVSLIEKLGCAVLCQPDGKSLVPESHPQFKGTFWFAASECSCSEIVMNSDLWVTVGARWSDYHAPGKGTGMASEAHRLLSLQDEHIQIPGMKPIQGISLTHMVTAIANSSIPSNNSTIANHTVTFGVNGHSHTEHNAPLTLTGIIPGIQHILKPGDTLIAETGDSWFNAQKIRLPPGTDFHMQMMYGSIGWSLPATLGCQLARPGGRAILMIGDGSFQMTAQELSTMIRCKANSVIFIFNNLGYGIETAIHDGPYNYISNWNYSAFASTLCSVFHTRGDGNPYLLENGMGDELNSSLFTMSVKTQSELLVALDRIQREKEKLIIVECCIQPSDVSGELCRFGNALGQKD